MKKLIKLSYFVICSLLLSNNALAQTIIAYVDAETVIQAMPEWTKAKADVEVISKELEKELKADEQKMVDYAKDISTKRDSGLLTPVQLQEADKKLQEMKGALQKKAQDAQKTLGEKEAALLKPVYDKFNQSLETVAVANKYNYISDKKLFLYMDDGIDATAKVRAALGL